jgi:hypothetical protein
VAEQRKSAPNSDEAEVVANAMLTARWGMAAVVTEQDLRQAREFIAMADALIAFRSASASRRLCATLETARKAAAAEAAIDRTPCPHGVSYPQVCPRCYAAGRGEPEIDRGNEDGA